MCSSAASPASSSGGPRKRNKSNLCSPIFTQFRAKEKEEGVVKLESGLLYKELRAGNEDGKTPTINSPCECHYAGTLIDGTEFDSSYKRGKPLTFAPNQVIKG